MAVFTRQSISNAHQNSAVCAVNEGLVKNSQSERPNGNAPNNRYGRRRPKRVRVLSEKKPTIGSVTASHIFAVITAIPARAGARYTVSVRYVSVQNPIAVKNKLPPMSAIPNPIFFRTGSRASAKCTSVIGTSAVSTVFFLFIDGNNLRKSPLF